MRSPVRIAVAGTNWIGRVHVGAYLGLPREEVEVVAVCDADPEACEQASALFTGPKPRVFAGYDEMLAWGQFDAVDICGPNRYHDEWAKKAFRAGKHVSCEKPLAPTLARAEAMCAAQEAAGMIGHVSFNQLRSPKFEIARGLIDRGDLGTILRVHVGWSRRHGVPFWGYDFTDEEKAGGGPLVDLGPHCICFLLGAMGNQVGNGWEVADAFTWYQRGEGQHGRGPYAGGKWRDGVMNVEYAAQVMLRAGNVSATVEASFAEHVEAERLWFQFWGSDGGLLVERTWTANRDDDAHDARDRIVLFTTEEVGGRMVTVNREYNPDGEMATTSPLDGRLETAQEFVRVLNGEQRTASPFCFGLHVQRVIQRGYDIARAKHPAGCTCGCPQELWAKQRAAAGGPTLDLRDPIPSEGEAGDEVD
jgi:predicted dehydrogenase